MRSTYISLYRFLISDDPSSFVVILLWNYYLCVNTDPGTVPDTWARFASSRNKSTPDTVHRGQTRIWMAMKLRNLQELPVTAACAKNISLLVRITADSAIGGYMYTRQTYILIFSADVSFVWVIFTTPD